MKNTDIQESKKSILNDAQKQQLNDDYELLVADDEKNNLESDKDMFSDFKVLDPTRVVPNENFMINNHDVMSREGESQRPKMEMMKS